MRILRQILKRLIALALTFVVGVGLSFVTFQTSNEKNSEITQIHSIKYIKPLELPKGAGLPNICHITLKVNDNREITLHSESFGNLDNTATVKDRLAEIMKQRAKNGVYSERTNEVENTVIVHISPAVDYADVIKLLSEMESVGAKPILSEVQECFVKVGGKCVY